MRTTIRLDDDLLRELKKRAAERGTTLTALIQDALRAELAPADAPDAGPFQMLTYGEGEPRPGVDLDDSAKLRDLMDGLR